MVARRVSQVVVETEVLNETPTVRASQVLVEAEINQHRDVLISQVVVEVEVLVPVDYSARPAAMLEIQWNGIAWDDESPWVIRPVTYEYGVMAQGGLSDLGMAASVAMMTVMLDNSDGRYSEDRAGSQAAIYGLFQVKIRFSAGYYVGETPDLGQIFIGRIQDPIEDEANARVTLVCQGFDQDLQQDALDTVANEGKRADELIGEWATALGFTDTDLDRGYAVVPWHYLDASDCLAAMRQLAEAEGGIGWVDAQDGYLKFWSWPHWVGAASATTVTRDYVAGSLPTENVRVRRNPRDARDVVNVVYVPRRLGESTTIHSLTAPIVLPANGSQEVRLRFRYPLGRLDSFTTRAHSGGGANMDAYLTVGTTSPASATEWVTTLTNTHPTEAIVVDKFTVVGWPIEGLPNREYRAEASVPLTVSRRHDVYPGQPVRLEVRSRYALQTEAQAKLIGDLKLQRLQEPALMLTIGPVPGDADRHVGDVVTVNLSEGISTINTPAVLLYRKGTFGVERWEESWSAVALGDLYEYTDVSEGTGDGYFVVGTSRLGFGRLGY